MIQKDTKKIRAISLFASGGIGDLALQDSNADVLVANELLSERASLFRHNFPKTKMMNGDIWELREDIIKTTKDLLGTNELDIVLATPPCQGMSKNGQGKLLKGIRDGKKPKIDVRNRLIIPTLEIIKALQPKIAIFENVPEMKDTVIDDEAGNLINIIEYIRNSLGKDYVGKAEVVEFADYGIPQRRKRLITIFSRIENLKNYFKIQGSFLPPKTHSSKPTNAFKKWVSVRDMITDLPPLDGKNVELANSSIPFHNVPVLDPKKYEWIKHTPPEKGAFDNQCINEKCGYKENPAHEANRDEGGVNRASTDTPLFCLKCGEILPRPYTLEKDGTKRIMSGYTSAYKRMRWDLPSSTLTTNMCYPSSDHKLHPDQNRVLSLYEAFRLHTLDRYSYEWIHDDGERARDTLIREVIGESIPPLAISIIITHLLQVKPEHYLLPLEQQLSLTY